MRAYNSLKRNNIVKVGQLLQLKDDDLLRMRNFGKKSLDEMKERLRMRGFIVPETRGRRPRRSRTATSRSTTRRRPDRGPPDRRPQAQPQAGPAPRLYKNLTVSVLRYERVKTTEAKAKEISGRVEKMITLAKRGDLAARRAVVAQFPNEPLVVDQAVRRDRAQVRRPDVRVTPGSSASASAAATPPRSSRSNSSERTMRTSSRGAREGAPRALPRHGRI